MNFKHYKNFIFVVFLFISAISVFAREKDNYTLDIRQSVNLPGGKVAGDDSTATIPYEKTTNGEVDLAYSITIPKTKKNKFYRICILMPVNINPSISSHDIQGTIKEYPDLGNDYDKYFVFLNSDYSAINSSDLESFSESLSRCFVLRELYKKYGINKDTISDYYACLIDLNSSKNQIENKFEFTINIPSSYKNRILYSKISSYAYVGSKIVNLSPKLFSLKIR